jgi:amidophosphoribosyltransferase
VTGDVTQEYLSGIEDQRKDAASKPGSEDGDGQMDLNLVSRSES